MIDAATAEARETPDQFSAWRLALATGKPVEYTRGSPTAGYFKARGRNPDRSIRWDALAIWRAEESGDWICWRTGPYPPPSHVDEIEELFVTCNSTPISYELFMTVSQGGAWPEDVAPVEVVAELPPHEGAAAELKGLREQAKAWLDGIGKVQTQVDADKCGNFADAFAKIEKRATDQHKAEKAPHLEAGRIVDAAWKPVIESAGLCKSWAKKAAEAFLLAEKARLAAEAKARADEAARIERENERARIEAERTGAPPPVAEQAAPPPPPVRAKAGNSGRSVGLRSRTVHTIVDVRALLMFFADLNEPNPDLMATLQILVNRMRSAGVTVPGVETKTIEEAA